MLLNGKKPVHNIKTLVLPRDGQEPLIFKAAAVTNMDDFEKLCPVPDPPKKTLRGGERVVDLEDKNFKLAISQIADKRWNFIILTSLQATEGLVWETVDMADSSTWDNWRKEATDSGLSLFEINRLTSIVVDANSLSDATLDEAKKSFLAGMVQE